MNFPSLILKYKQSMSKNLNIPHIILKLKLGFALSGTNTALLKIGGFSL